MFVPVIVLLPGASGKNVESAEMASQRGVLPDTTDRLRGSLVIVSDEYVSDTSMVGLPGSVALVKSMGKLDAVTTFHVGQANASPGL